MIRDYTSKAINLEATLKLNIFITIHIKRVLKKPFILNYKILVLLSNNLLICLHIVVLDFQRFYLWSWDDVNGGVLFVCTSPLIDSSFLLSRHISFVFMYVSPRFLLKYISLIFICDIVNISLLNYIVCSTAAWAQNPYHLK